MARMPNTNPRVELKYVAARSITRYVYMDIIKAVPMPMREKRPICNGSKLNVSGEERWAVRTV